jgi:hypothetical protein
MAEFINENYLWFIIGGAVLLMALIGYIAEKTNFGRGGGNKKEKKDKEVVVVRESIPSEPVIQPNIVPDADNLGLEPSNVENDENIENIIGDNNVNNDVIDEDLTVPLNLTVESEEPLYTPEEDLTVPLEPNMESIENDTIDNVDEDLTVPLEPNMESIENDTIDNVDEDLTVPLDFSSAFNNTINDEPTAPENNEIPEVMSEEPVSFQEISDNDIVLRPNDQTMELPDIDSLDEETEEDVWKF